jgi:membrane-associated phospholipid phosphatase
MTVHEHCHTCPKILKSTNACYRPELLFGGNLLEAIWEIIMVFSSTAPYFLFVIVVGYSLFSRTSRGLCVAIFLVAQQVLCDAIKLGIAQARPPGACSTSFGLPSNHSSFGAALSTWLLLEWFVLDRNAPFKSWRYYKLLRNSFLVFAPFIAVSRHHLNYHTPGQIVAGSMIGFISASSVFALMYYTVIVRYDYTKSPLYKIWTFLKFQDNLIGNQTPGSAEKVKQQ